MATDAWGIDDGWIDTHGAWQAASPTTVEAIRASVGDPAQGRPIWIVRPGDDPPLQGRCHLALDDGDDLGEIERLPPDLPLGIHDLTPLDGGPRIALIVSPGRAVLDLDRRDWGVALQVPTTRSTRSWGIGDLGDVRAVAAWLAAEGADLLALSPLHAPTPIAPIDPSPYYPSSRRWRSPLLIRVDDVDGADSPEIRALADDAHRLLAAPLVHRDRCWALQHEALRHLWAARSNREHERLARWRATQGDALEGWIRFCVLAERHGTPWQRWPAGLRHPAGPEVDREMAAAGPDLAFHAWLQLLVEDQLDAAREPGLRLVQDLAVGCDPGGADAWLWQDLLAFDFSIGAPPDAFVPEGQRWGLPPWVPGRLRDAGYRPLAALLRGCLGAGGGLRIDHVMGLQRTFWVPQGGDPADGAYVRFGSREVLEVVALESARAGGLVVGEDLGTVEPGFRDDLTRAGIHSTKVIWFEDRPPSEWPHQALAMVTTHDLPTVAGVCTGVDAPPPMVEHLEGVVGPIADRSPAEIAAAAHGALAQSPAVLAVATMEDLVGQTVRPNHPGTDRPTNWSLALPVAVDDLPGHPVVAPSLATLRARSGT